MTGHISGTSGGEALAACQAILDKGGSAVDAACAYALAQVTLSSGSWVSFAGILGMTHFEAATGEVTDLNAEYHTVMGEDDAMSIPAQDLSGGLFAKKKSYHFSGRTVYVPGFMAGIEAAHKRFGKVSWAEVFEPSIRMAEEGIPFTAGLVQCIEMREDVLAHWPETRELFQDENGNWYKEGDLFRQPRLAETLRKVVEQGAAYMYSGDWARKLVEMVQSDGGKLSLDDMRNYQAMWTTPLSGTFHDATIYTHGAPSTGGTSLLEGLKVLEVADLKGRYGHFKDNADALYYMSQICRLPITDYSGGQFGVDNQMRLTTEHAQRVWELVQKLETPFGAEHLQELSPKHSDGLTVVDGQGNIAAITHSINTVTYGEYGRFVDGVSIPDSASFQQALTAAVGPGQRLPSPLEIGIVMQQGRARYGFASIGAGLHHKTVSCIYNTVEFGMSVEDAQAQPSLGGQHWSAFSGDKPGAQTVEIDKFDSEILKAASRNGIELMEDEFMRGIWVASEIDDQGQPHGTSANIRKPRGVSY